MQEMVIHSQAKNLVREAVIGRFEPHLYQIDIPYVNVNEVFLPVLIKNHWTLYVYDLENRRIQLLDSRPGRKKTMLSGVQQNLAKVVLWLAAHKKEVSPYDLRTFNFITPDVPLQTNEHDCGVFVMKFMELWSMGGSPNQSMWLKIMGNGPVDRKALGARPVDIVLQPLVNRSNLSSAGRAHPTDERECILAPSSGYRPVDQFRSTGSWRFGRATG
ncbi:hypothetical protein CK203_064847 [Vitis vinifera]|uniref:Ubiquitin-like protease family profile domain-containing protein n=1 Tax=Vitis vinifera TaxID=29760 RepID=A0A438G3L1_VITVI|nr:hypothetical protein CK203_064847 [Vitis vinifera]